MKKKQLAFLFLIVLGLGLLAPFSTSWNSATAEASYWSGRETNPEIVAGWTDWVHNWAGTLGKIFLSAIIGTVFLVLIILSSPFLSLSQWFLTLVSSSSFINIKFTDNPFVNEGWGIIRDLTGILIIIGLIVIALATILRIQSYQMKKTLPVLLIVALLINFTPMLCGLVIDASNFIMEHFLKGGGLATAGFLERIGMEISHLYDFKDPAETLGKGIAVVGFNIIGGIIFLLYAFLFLFRYIALWMLVILSPLALFCYIFPATKKMWNMWLSQFLQWCFIGIPATFTIYLTNIMITELIEGNALEGISGGAEIFGYSLPLAFLLGGFLISLQTGAMGANLAITGFNWTKGKIWAGTKWGARKATKKPREKLGDLLGKDKAADEKEIKKLREEGKSPGFSYHLRKIPGARLLGRTLSAGATEADKKDIDKREKEAKGTSIDNQAKMMESISVLNRIAGLLAAMKDGNIKRLKDQGLLSNEKIKSIMKDAVKIYPTAMQDLRKISPKLSEEVGKTKGISQLTLKEAGIEFSEKDREKGWENLSEKLFATAKPKDIEDIWDEDTIEAYAKSRVSHLFAAPNQLAAATRAGGRGFINEYNKKGKELADKEGLSLEAFYEKHNKTLWSYRQHSPAQGLGIGFEAVGTKEISEVEIERIKKERIYKQPWEMTKEEREEEEKKEEEETKKEEGKGPSDTGEAGAKKRDTGEAGAKKRKKPDTGKG